MVFGGKIIITEIQCLCWWMGGWCAERKTKSWSIDISIVWSIDGSGLVGSFTTDQSNIRLSSMV